MNLECAGLDGALDDQVSESRYIGIARGLKLKLNLDPVAIPMYRDSDTKKARQAAAFQIGFDTWQSLECIRKSSWTP